MSCVQDRKVKYTDTALITNRLLRALQIDGQSIDDCARLSKMRNQASSVTLHLCYTSTQPL